MYFITTKKEGYVLFSMSPSERYAVGLTEQGRVHLLQRSEQGVWTVAHEWDTKQFSHTAFMSALHRREEPTSIEQWLDILPAEVR